MSKELKTGIIAIIIIGLFVWGYNFMKGQDVFKTNARHFFIEYKNIQGLNKSSIVTINGLQVGKVVDIKFNREKRGQLIVELLLENDFEFSKNSIARIYASSLLGGQSLAIIPSYEGEMAVSGDYLKGEVESDIFSTVGEKLNPLQAKLENGIVSADSLFLGLNQVLNKDTRESLSSSFVELEHTIQGLNKTIVLVNEKLNAINTDDIKETLTNAKKMTANFSKVSDSLANANIGEIVRKSELTLNHVNSLLKGIENGKGSIGKLINDTAMYDNLTNVSKELEELLREIKLNPKRFVHFSVFGKKATPYNPENNKNNKTNQ